MNLQGPAGEPIEKALVSIVPWRKTPFKILELKAKSGENISYKLEEVEKADRLEYLLTVKNLKRGQGRYSDTIILKTDSEIQPKLQIRVSGYVSPEEFVTITPKAVNLRGPAGEPIKASVSIVPKEKYPFKVLEVKVESGENISCNLEEDKKAEGPEYLLTVENLKKGQGRYSDAVILKTDNKNLPKIKVEVSGNIGAEEFVTITPKKAILYGYTGELIEASVSIIPKEKHPFKVLEVKAKSGENICYKLEEVEGSKKTEYLLTVENLKEEKGHYSDTIILKTDSKILPEIQIRVSCNIFGSEQKELYELFEKLVEQQKGEGQ